MVFIEVSTANIVCEYKNCKQEAVKYQAENDSEEAYYNAKARCGNHLTRG